MSCKHFPVPPVPLSTHLNYSESILYLKIEGMCGIYGSNKLVLRSQLICFEYSNKNIQVNSRMHSMSRLLFAHSELGRKEGVLLQENNA